LSATETWQENGADDHSSVVRYEAHPWNMGSFDYRPGGDFAQGFHRFGAKIEPNYNISIWVDDRPIGTFAAEQYCDDAGKPVGV
jgi:hypothetical protein